MAKQGVNLMIRIIIIALIIYGIIQIPFIIKAYWGRRKYQQKIKDGERQNQKIMEEQKKRDHR
ncbi:conserved hypothetical protein [Pediococcus acidilactici NGRI 0510Q]|uniref:Uncharacterized protein n=2 Tax=Pediococcus acidilactici TaxID=1254 RepID=E0NHH6_PEDAC|nr:hypothetical protein [Pediococcus acidilactici]EFL95187.1 hypothetical protein HMPREF0623_1499 [Pediococcus acidilactici DSM 20284]GAC45636.1 conserved hypothetical protein [Pediococcus acidilactici NGRI 0510Q]KAF0370008.1 hypothetical protein GBO60_08440 [Pediococcus acidilactici]KAF0388686.1 hypothetical protein GBO67_08440 [Pediococcus acidilactici]KAF0420882.1 hypothetical protein GBO82_08245 [Pediococcus acidilactici]